MSSPQQEKMETKGGHPPAGKALTAAGLFFKASFKVEGLYVCAQCSKEIT